MLKKFLYSNNLGAKLSRTLLEVILGWFLTYIPDILNLFTMPENIRMLVASFLTLVITAILGFINDNKKPEIVEQ